MNIGPFFVLDAAADGPGWQPFADLVRDPAVLERRIAATRDALAGSSRQQPEDIEWRVAASIAQLNLSARVLSPILASAVVEGVVPAVSLETLWWQPVLGGAFPLAIRGGSAIRIDAGSSHDAARAVRGQLEDILAELIEATRRVGGLAPQIAWGNVGSALATAAALIARADPSVGGRARAVTAEVLAVAPLAATGTLTDTGFRRTTCCLFYRVAPSAGLCGDCVLTTRPGAR
jgi:hypothetical protein